MLPQRRGKERFSGKADVNGLEFDGRDDVDVVELRSEDTSGRNIKFQRDSRSE